MQERTIETERLILRPPVAEDFADCAVLWGDPEVTRFITGQPSSPEESWARLLRLIGHWAALGFGYWTVREQDTGRHVGQVGFADYKRDMKPPLGDAPEIGWVLAPWAAGRGYATEAVGAALAWGDRHFGERATMCIVHPDHHRSVRVAEKAGYQAAGRALYKGQDRLLFRRRPPLAAPA